MQASLATCCEFATGLHIVGSGIWNITPVTGHKWVRPVPKARYRYHVKGFKIKVNTKHGTGTMLRRQMRKYSNWIHKMATPQAFINTYVPKVPSVVKDNCKTLTDFWFYKTIGSNKSNKSHRWNQNPGVSVCVQIVCGWGTKLISLCIQN